MSHLPQTTLNQIPCLNPLLNAYASVGCHERPAALAPVWRNEFGGIDGALIAYDWASYELVATTREAVQGLLGCLYRVPGHGWQLSFPDWAMPDVVAHWPEVTRGYEVFHICTPGTYQPPPVPGADIVQLSPALVEQCAFELEVVKSLSGLSLRPSAMRTGVPAIYGAIVDGQIVSLADGSAMSDQVAIVQQVYTIPGYRRRGLATAVVARLTEALFALGLVCAYAASTANQPSLALCRSLGYKPMATFGVAEYEDGGAV
ncbi:MAG: GNAT family N-acetyltransferase [Chloroflexi bacterium]|nr:GNAT family N-acetyltransferase [Chloroflexota bacterium]